MPGWEKEYPGIGECIDEILQFEGADRGWKRTPEVNVDRSQLGEPEIIEENDSRIVQKHGDGTVEILQKGKDFHDHIAEWPIKTRKD